jgi:hypothetical protein
LPPGVLVASGDDSGVLVDVATLVAVNCGVAFEVGVAVAFEVLVGAVVAVALGEGAGVLV